MARRADDHADVAVEGPQPYDKCNEIGYEKQYGQPGYDRYLKIRTGQSIEDAKAEQEERKKSMPGMF